MKESDDSKIRYRVQLARESLYEAEVLAANQGWRGAINRMFYACFYAASALNVTEGLDSSKHSGVQGTFNQTFVKPGLFPSEVAQVYNRLFSYRNRTDYRDFEDADETSVMTYLPRVRHFIQVTESVLSSRYAIDVQVKEE